MEKDILIFPPFLTSNLCVCVHTCIHVYIHKFFSLLLLIAYLN